MKRQIGMWPAVGLVIIALVVGLFGGAIAGAAGGYWYGSRDRATPTTQAGAPDASDTAPASTQSDDQIVAKVNPAVVTVIANLGTSQGLPGPGGRTSTGSGMIIDADGHIVTNNHVVENGQSFEVIYSDGRTVPATLIGTDAFQDVAVIKVDPPVPATVTFADSDALQAGQRVIAIGSALGEFHNTITDGVVSGIGRSLDTGEGYRLPNLVQHDAPINPGNSGGPLIDTNGDVVGMNTAIVTGNRLGQPSAQGLSFAIESNVVKSTAEQLIANGKIDRPYMGIHFRPIAPGIPGAERDAAPVVIAQVASDSPAEQAGLQPGDVIVAVNGTTLDDQHPFLNVVYDSKPGDTIELQVERGGETQTITITLGETPDTTR